MKTTKTQYFLWKRADSDAVVMYAPSNATSEVMPYYYKNHDFRSFSNGTWPSLPAFKNVLERNSYHFICSLLIPSNHTIKDLAKYYTTIKKNLSL